LTEGDSAKALAVAGLDVVGRDNFGVFPLRGKLLNVREASGPQLINNTEIQHIKQIMGLKQGQVYKSTEGLRYGHLMIMTDQVGPFSFSSALTRDVPLILLSRSPYRIKMDRISRVFSSTSSTTSFLLF
jgi:hypothetical protein